MEDDDDVFQACQCYFPEILLTSGHSARPIGEYTKKLKKRGQDYTSRRRITIRSLTKEFIYSSF